MQKHLYKGLRGKTIVKTNNICDVLSSYISHCSIRRHIIPLCFQASLLRSGVAVLPRHSHQYARHVAADRYRRQHRVHILVDHRSRLRARRSTHPRSLPFKHLARSPPSSDPPSHRVHHRVQNSSRRQHRRQTMSTGANRCRRSWRFNRRGVKTRY